MDKLKLVRGVEDAFEHFNFFQDGIANTFKNLLAGFGIAANESFRISGCVVTVQVDTPAVGQTTYNVTAGVISLEGEVLPVDAHSVVISTVLPTVEEAYWGVDESFSDVSPAEIFGGGQTNVQAVRKGVLLKSTNPPVDRMKPKAKYLKWIIQDQAFEIGELKFWDPRPSGQALSDVFDLDTGIGIEGTRREGWIIPAIHDDYKADYAGGRVIVSYDPADADFDAVGKKGGEKEHLLTGQESGIQDHDHEYAAVGNLQSGPNIASGSSYHEAPPTTPTDTSSSGNVDAVESHNNMQPYIVAATIMRIA